jgi:hypothetical protein
MDLDEFAEQRETRKVCASYLDTLPEDVQAAILESSHGHAVVVAWLRSEGYDRATQNIVSRWRHKHGWSPS